MILWWIGNIIFILVIIPVVLLILQRVLVPALEIMREVDDITDHVAAFPPHLEALQELGTTSQLVKEVNVDLERYVRALDKLA
jgi:hypothetical protein